MLYRRMGEAAALAEIAPSRIVAPAVALFG